MQLTDPDDLLESGVEIMVQPPGKKLKTIALLSGGEKSLTAAALIISLFLTKPSPFCLLDEADAALDDVNVVRFNEIIKELAKTSQLVVITHNKATMELADTLYGVTMERKGVSKIVSVKLKNQRRPMLLDQIIEELVEMTPGARAAILADWEGEAVVTYTSGEETDYEIKFVGAHHGILLTRAKEMIDRLSLGSPTQISFKHDLFNVITAPVNNDYYIVLTLGPDALIAQANMTLKKPCLL